MSSTDNSKLLRRERFSFPDRAKAIRDLVTSRLRMDHMRNGGFLVGVSDRDQEHGKKQCEIIGNALLTYLVIHPDSAPARMVRSILDQDVHLRSNRELLGLPEKPKSPSDILFS